jgi:putative redox protein
LEIVTDSEIPAVTAVATLAASFDANHIKRLFGDDLAKLKVEGEADVRLGGRPFKIMKGFINDVAPHNQEERIRKLGKPLLILHAPFDQYVGVDNATADLRGNAASQELRVARPRRSPAH